MEIEIVGIYSENGKVRETAVVNGGLWDVKFPKAFEEAKKEIVRNHVSKGNSWETCSLKFLKEKLQEEIDEWNDSNWHSRDELLDIANLSLMIHDRMKDD